MEETRGLLDTTRRDLDMEKGTSLQLRKDFEAFKEECITKFKVLEDAYSKVAKRVDTLVAPPANDASSAQSGGEGHTAPTPNCNADLPYELRTCAKLGGFPYDTPKDVLVKEARECLKSAGVDEGMFKWLHSVHDKGSWVLLTFLTPQALQSARAAVSAAHLVMKLVGASYGVMRQRLKLSYAPLG